MYLVTGATGKTGSVVADTLLSEGEPVTVFVRDESKGRPWRDRGANIAVGTLEETGLLERALSGVDGAYLLIPPIMNAEDTLAAQRRVADSLAQAVARSGVPNVVFLSSIGANLSSGTGPIVGLHYAESALKPAAKNVTFLRAGFFYENWIPMIDQVKSNGVLNSFLIADRKIWMVGSQDIGRVAAERLMTPVSGVRILELAGPLDYSPNDIGRELSNVFGRDVRVSEVPKEAVLQTIKSFGFSDDLARLYAEMIASANAGRIVPEGEGTELRRGVLSPAEAFRTLLQPNQARAA